ncbi:MAG TPA: CPBP family intramembrane glutamic endopeptidase [Chloroflexota bacterium]|nr:CPBP family intramembrane glutamic endopeptidase [Chloroflexota bacterium]
MIDWRAAVTWVPSLGGSVRDMRRGLHATWRVPLARLNTRFARSTTTDVPWTWADAGAALLWTAALTVGGVLGLILFRLLLSLLFTVASATGRVRAGAFDQLTRALQPYVVAATLLLLGGMLCCAVLYGIYRCAVRPYQLAWSALYFRGAGRRVYAMVALLFIPISVAGAVVLQVESRVLGAPVHNPQIALLTREMPALPLNFLLLFLLLAVLMPVAEETVFRAFVYRLLRTRLPVWAAATMSAAAFAVLHGVPVLMPWFFFMGLVFALVVEKTQSIYSSMILHSMANVLALLGLIAVMYNW